jgi:hypothetical protein
MALSTKHAPKHGVEHARDGAALHDAAAAAAVSVFPTMRRQLRREPEPLANHPLCGGEVSVQLVESGDERGHLRAHLIRTNERGGELRVLVVSLILLLLLLLLLSLYRRGGLHRGARRRGALDAVDEHGRDLLEAHGEADVGDVAPGDALEVEPQDLLDRPAGGRLNAGKGPARADVVVAAVVGGGGRGGGQGAVGGRLGGRGEGERLAVDEDRGRGAWFCCLGDVEAEGLGGRRRRKKIRNVSEGGWRTSKEGATRKKKKKSWRRLQHSPDRAAARRRAAARSA